MNGAFHKAVKDELCWLICASDELECPDDWVSASKSCVDWKLLTRIQYSKKQVRIYY